MSFKIILTLALVACVSVRAQEPYSDSELHPAPEPYSFTFDFANDDGSSGSRQETGDTNGRITGFYTIKGLDGQDRRVDYVADENGFRAEVSTSEVGTISHEPDSAVYTSNAPSIQQLSALWEQSGGNREQFFTLANLPNSIGTGTGAAGLASGDRNRGNVGVYGASAGRSAGAGGAGGISGFGASVGQGAGAGGAGGISGFSASAGRSAGAGGAGGISGFGASAGRSAGAGGAGGISGFGASVGQGAGAVSAGGISGFGASAGRSAGAGGAGGISGFGASAGRSAGAGGAGGISGFSASAGRSAGAGFGASTSRSVGTAGSPAGVGVVSGLGRSSSSSSSYSQNSRFVSGLIGGGTGASLGSTVGLSASRSLLGSGSGLISSRTSGSSGSSLSGFRSGSTTLTTGLIDGGGAGVINLSDPRLVGTQYVNQQGYVLVPVSAARSAGLSGIQTSYSSNVVPTITTGSLLPTGGVIPIIPVNNTALQTTSLQSQPATLVTSSFQAQPSSVSSFITSPAYQTGSSYYQTRSFRTTYPIQQK